MIFFDKDGYYHHPSVLSKEVASVRLLMLGITDDADKYIKSIESESREKLSKETFHDFVKDIWSSDRDRFAFFGHTMLSDDVSSALMMYHWSRFLSSGRIVYKIREHKANFLKDIKLEIPARMLVIPHKEFIISIPFGCIQTPIGHLVNIYVSTEPYDASWYTSGYYKTDGGVGDLVSKHTDIKRVVRAYGIFQPDKHSFAGRTIYYQMPIVEDMDIQELFDFLISRASFESKECVATVFNFVLNFCAYLSTKDPDVQNVLGIKYKCTTGNPKKIRQAEFNNRLYGYNYTDVGRIYDTRYISESSGSGQKILKRFKVRSHIRAQWFGSAENKHQKLIIINEYEKGTDLSELGGKIVQTG